MQKDMHKFDTITYRDQANSVVEACEWLCKHGLNLQNTRINKYKNDLIELADYFEADKIKEFQALKSFDDIVNSTAEASEFIYIYRGLSRLTDKTIIAKLRDFIKGPESSNHELPSSSSNRARNVSFELYMAALFVLAGFEIDLTSLADIIVKINEFQVFIECKRPQSETGVNGNINDALSQLNKRYEVATDQNLARGIIALSVSKISNQNTNFIETNDELSIRPILFRKNKEFADKFGKKWQHPSNEKTIGAILQLNTSAYFHRSKLVTHCNESVLDPSNSLRKRDWISSLLYPPTPTNILDQKIFDTIWKRFNSRQLY